jgi:hypothetical protein
MKEKKNGATYFLFAPSTDLSYITKAKAIDFKEISSDLS